MGIKIFLCIFCAILIGLFVYGATDEISIAIVAMIGSSYIFLVVASACISARTANNTTAQDIFVNGAKVATQEETVNFQNSAYNISIFGLDTGPQNLDLNEYVFSADTESQTIAIVPKSQDSDVKSDTLYEIHINGSDVNIESLNLNDFVITVDEGNRWIMLTEK